MSSILAGLFGPNSDYKKLEKEIEDLGFLDSEYIVYLSDDHHNSQYLASVEIKNRDMTDKLRHIFSENHVHKTYLFENMSIDQASYSNLKRLIDARSKAEIHSSPDVRIKVQHDGMNSEVKA
ncbi:hypothetical protein OF897_11405 [Chryseobacterium formosus]|uniref:Uncharacterized protein n=1 Tax=Chryseobacterium formosus TaxID=1537363 RepID=A0ABT3XQY1_9FLAO|nr:hypothetical protein [Chryseobacterium formosus]MCX8524519.1 hypothetical protein [Chryseobacterium formosus]